jgi:hypothetical protein
LRGGGGDSIFLLGQLTGGAVAICKKMDKTLVLIQCKSNEPCDIRELCLQSDLVVSNDLEIHFPVYQMNE